MTNTVKSKFAGLLRGLLRRFDDTGATNGTTVVASPGLMAATKLSRNSSPAAARHTRPQPDSATPPAAPVNGSNGLELPLPSIIAGLPMDLRAKLVQTPPTCAFFSIPV